MKEADLLQEPFRADGDLKLADGRFVARAPWAWARYDGVSLKPGWWAFEWDTPDPQPGAMLRISSARDPGIKLSLDRSGVLLMLSGGAPYDLAFLASPWPGDFSFGKLRLRRLNGWEVARLYAASARRLVLHDNPMTLVRGIFQRLLARQSVGVRVGARPQIEGEGPPPESRPAVAGGLADRSILEGIGLVADLADGDLLHADAVDILSAAFAANPRWVAAYCDRLDGAGFLARPEWDEVLARHHAYASPAGFVRADIADDAGFETIKALVRSHGAASVGRIALPLVKGAPVDVLPIARPAAPVRREWPRVSVVIPTKDRLDLLERCLTGLKDVTAYPELEIIIVDNGCTHPGFAARIEAASRGLEVSIVADHGPFNFSRLINGGVRAAKGEVLLLLNDDVEPVEAGWLHRMVDSALRSDTGAVGARLLYADRTVQHAGVALGLGGVCGHIWKGLTEAEANENPYVALPSRRLAVTGACIAVKRSLFERVGGLDEAAFPVALNDIDFCLRLHERGFSTLYQGDAVLLHHEGQSRGRDDEDVAKRVRLAAETGIFLSRWRGFVERDPFSSPCFDLHREDGGTSTGLVW